MRPVATAATDEEQLFGTPVIPMSNDAEQILESERRLNARFSPAPHVGLHEGSSESEAENGNPDEAGALHHAFGCGVGFQDSSF